MDEGTTILPFRQLEKINDLNTRHIFLTYKNHV